jgi:hypothetical protein
VATVSGNSVTIIGTGTTNITASQAGDAVYFPATNVIQSLTVNPAPIADQTVTASPTSGTCSVNVMVSLGGSQTGVDYYLKDDATNTVIEGPLVGTGSGISFTNEMVSATKTYNVYGVPSGERINALQFDGVDGYVAIPNTINSALNTNHITVETWAYIPSSDTTDQYTALVGQEIGNVSGTWKVGFAVYLLDGEMGVGFYNGGWNELPTKVNYPKDQWIHIAATYDQTALRLYINGVEESWVGATAALPINNLGWRMGRRWDGTATSQHVFGGSLAETRIWNVAKTGPEITTNKDKSILTDTGLVASYPYVETAGATVTDYSGNNNNATLTSMAGDATNWVVPTGVLEMTTTPTVTVTPIADQNVTLVQPTFDTAIVSLEGSEVGMEYYLRDHVDNSIIEGPIAGTGSGFSFATDAITADKTYNVLATDVNPANGLKKAFSFDGVDDYALIPSTVGSSLTTFVTVETNVYIPSSDDTDVNASIITS